jgi:membrane associated rhomboid family serine protease
MIFPLSDTPNPGGRPYVTYGLIALNVLVYLLVSLPLSGTPPDPDDPALVAYLQVVREQLPPGVPLRAVVNSLSAYDLYVFEHGYKPAAPQIPDLFYSLFLHGGFMHLVGNMLFLWIYGDNVEYRLGRPAYLFWYLATGAAATLVFALFSQGSSIPLVGASGAISGVLGFYFLWFPRNRVRVFVFLFPFFMNVVAIPARIVLGLYLVIDNLLPFVLTGSDGGGVAHGAHIGGFVAGLAAAWLIDRRQASAARGDFDLA